MKKQMKTVTGFLGLIAVLVSCGTTAPSDSLGEKPTIAGKLSNYTQGAKVLKVLTGGSLTSASVTGTLNADGSFSVVLPTPIAGDLRTATVPTCLTGSASNSVPDAKISIAVSQVFDDASKTIPTGSVVRSTLNAQTSVVGAKAKLAQHFYADKEFTFTYENCATNNSATIYNGSITLKAGWNVVYQELEILEVSNTSPAFPTKTKIGFGLGATGLDWRLDGNASLPFKAPFSAQ
jgi:hypothetical protein